MEDQVTGAKPLRLSAVEKSWHSQVYEAVGTEVPFWVVELSSQRWAGANWWYRQLFQQVVEHFTALGGVPGSGRVLFVQVGETHPGNPPLTGVLDLRGQTGVRQLVRLLYHAKGLLCVTREFADLAGRVESKYGERPCVLVGEAGFGDAAKVIQQLAAWFARPGRRLLAPKEWRQAEPLLQGQVLGGLERVFAVACNQSYFPGLRALLHSIVAYHGSQVPVFLYHHGLTSAQLEEVRRLPLGVHRFELQQLPFPSAGMWEAKQQIFAHCLGRARCVQLLDADLVLVSAMDDVFEWARAGKLVSSADGAARTFGAGYAAYGPELPGRRQAYLNSGALCLDVVQHWDLVGLWAFAAQYAAYTRDGGWPLGLPGYGDQGVFNALAGRLGKEPQLQVLPEGPWCDSTGGCGLRIRRQDSAGRLRVWNVTVRAPQRLVHSTGPKWWTPEGVKHLQGFGDKLRCFEHFAAWQPPARGPGRCFPRSKVRLLVAICSCHQTGARRQAVRTSWLKRLPRGVAAVFFLGGGASPGEAGLCALAVPDDYAHLPEKVQAFCRRALEECDFDYLFKCDDDSYVCGERLLELTRSGADYLGSAALGAHGYASGGAGYLLSRRAVAVLAGARAPGQGPEDVWVGQALREAGICLQTTPRLRLDHHHWPAPDNDLVSAHWCSPALMRQIEQGFVAKEGEAGGTKGETGQKRAALGGHGPELMICRRRRFIFVHIPKTGGSSVVESLFPELVGRWGTYWSHFLPEDFPARLWREYFTFAFLRNPWDRMVSLYHYWCDGHYLDLPRWEVSFAEFCRNYKEIMVYRGELNVHARPQAEFLRRKAVPVKFCGRYEHLQKDFDYVCNYLGLAKVRLPRLIQSVNRKRGSYRQYYRGRPELIQWVGREFAADVAAGGYEF